jgi:hypothetical protein
MLERVALHQTRLRVPGIGLDAKGIALGKRGLLLFSGVDRLVSFLAVHAQEQSLAALLPGLELEVVRSKLGTREIVLGFDADSSERLDRVAETARLVGGFTFTGTMRHFVQYRDAGAPFGYDATELTATDAHCALYHSTFSQSYELERVIELKKLLLWLTPQIDASTTFDGREVWLLVAPGLGPTLASYFARSRVTAKAGLLPAPTEGSPAPAATQREQWLFHVQDPPLRLRSLLTRTPGIVAFKPEGPGAAVEVGYRHPIPLRACPIFDASALVLFRGGIAQALEVTPLPMLGDVRALVRLDVERFSETLSAPLATRDDAAVRVPIRLSPSSSARGALNASFVAPEEYELLRRLAYVLPPPLLMETKLAVTDLGAFLRCASGLDSLPIGRLYRQLNDALFVPNGFELEPRVDPDVLQRELGLPPDLLLFFRVAEPPLAIRAANFVPLQEAILQAERWTVTRTVSFDHSPPGETNVWFDPLGVLPLRGAQNPR